MHIHTYRYTYMYRTTISEKKRPKVRKRGRKGTCESLEKGKGWRKLRKL